MSEAADKLLEGGDRLELLDVDGLKIWRGRYTPELAKRVQRWMAPDGTFDLAGLAQVVVLLARDGDGGKLFEHADIERLQKGADAEVLLRIAAFLIHTLDVDEHLGNSLATPDADESGRPASLSTRRRTRSRRA